MNLVVEIELKIPVYSKIVSVLCFIRY